MNSRAKLLVGSVLVFLLMTGVSGSTMAAKQLSIATAGSTGAYYPIGAALAKVINDFVPGVYAVAEVTGGTVENIRLVSGNEADIGIATQMVVKQAQQGKPPFEKPITNLRTLFPIAGKDYEIRHAWQVLVPVNSPIKTLNDLKGKRVAVGPAGSGGEMYTNQILQVYGITYKDITPRFLSYGEAVSALEDGTVDVVIINSGIPTPAVVELGARMRVRLVPMSEDMVKKVIDEWGFIRQVIPAGTYEWQKEPVVTVTASYHVVFANKNMDADLAYQIVKAAMEHKAAIWASNALAKGFDETGVTTGLSDPPLHVGALKYFREIGVKIPASVIPPEAK